MSKFKVGDRVRALESVLGQFTAGHVYSVLDCDSCMVRINADDSGKRNGWGIEKFELAASCGACSPIRTVTRREIVPGVYGSVTVHNDMSVTVGRLDADKAREAAHILNQIAEVLEDG